MFRRKPASLKDKMLARGGGLADATASSVKRFSDRGPGKLDGYAAGVLGLGIVNWVSMSLFNFDLVKAVAGRKSVSAGPPTGCCRSAPSTEPSAAPRRRRDDG